MLVRVQGRILRVRLACRRPNGVPPRNMSAQILLSAPIDEREPNAIWQCLSHHLPRLWRLTRMHLLRRQSQQASYSTTRLTLFELTFYSNRAWAKCHVFGDNGTVSEV